jgi:hypothetical protein
MLKSFINARKPFIDIEKYVQFNFDLNNDIGGVFLIHNAFITYTEKDIKKSISNLMQSISDLMHSNMELTHIIYNTLEKGEKIIVDKLSDDFTEKNEFMEKLSNTICNSNTKNKRQRNKEYFYRCLLKRIKCGKKHYRRSFPINISTKKQILTDAEVIIFESNGLSRFIYYGPNGNYVDEMLYSIFKSERRISIIENIS